jgi:hypothetical protein
MSGSKVVTGHFLGILTEKRLQRHLVLNNGTEPQLRSIVLLLQLERNEEIGYFDFAKRFWFDEHQRQHPSMLPHHVNSSSHPTTSEGFLNFGRAITGT